VSPQQEKAVAEAAKRELHKSPGLKLKHWAAVHSPERGWHVALVDDYPGIAKLAEDRARNSLRTGDMRGFLDAASDALLAKCRAAFSDTPTP
jgi:hypothetical protein